MLQIMIMIIIIIYFFFFAVLGIKPRALHILGKDLNFEFCPLLSCCDV